MGNAHHFQYVFTTDKELGAVVIECVAVDAVLQTHTRVVYHSAR